ncbi:MAG: hypothetical protein PHC41_03705 [Lachnospiraceae bacterium]|nr:hypothetical protein [Lachnospiraceae bacterium]MDD3615313.1 hypothetical protein [Lachnospiraceae bacterium]
MRKKIIKKGSALLLVLLFVLSAFPLLNVKAASPIDTQRTDCSMDFFISGEFEDLIKVPGGVSIDLYRVAKIDESGNYQGLGAFSGMKFESIKQDGDSAAAWEAKAEEAVLLRDGADVAKGTATDENGEASVRDLPTGLYLVWTDPVDTDYYSYQFKPYLISLPNNYYYTTQNDDWQYNLIGDLALNLKPEQQMRYGNLLIQKNMINHHITMGRKATFVFRIDIVTPKNKSYCKIRALTFDEAGEKEHLIEQIPAGSAVTVTEAYSGSGYKLTADSLKVQQVVIPAEDTVSVAYANEHDGRIVGGYGVVNHFEFAEKDVYLWTPLADSNELKDAAVNSSDEGGVGDE